MLIDFFMGLASIITYIVPQMKNDLIFFKDSIYWNIMN
jgi:hypothetical protein